jgi:hypothetical protein
MKLKTGKNCTKRLEKKIRNQKNKDQSKKTTHDKLELNGEFEKKIKTLKIRNQENKDQIQKQNKLSGSFENLQGRQKN